MHERVKIPWETIPQLRKSYSDIYGTTLRGLQINYDVDPDDFLNYVHDLPLDEYIKADREIIKVLQQLPQRKFVFTNADANHAARVLTKIDASDFFVGIIDIRALGFACKPELGAYTKALELAAVKQAEQCLYVDDRPINLEPARNIGIYTILVGSDQPHPFAYRSIKSIKQLIQSVPELLAT